MPGPKLLIVFLMMMSNYDTLCQPSDTLFVASAVKNSIYSYKLATAHQSGLYNGGDFAEPPRTNEEHPYFLKEDWQTGSVEYKGQIYDTLPLLYDLTSQRLVTELFNSQLFTLVTEHVTWFTLEQRLFVNIDNTDNVNKGLPVSGYYEQVYDGRSKVLAHYVKVTDERIESSTIQIHFNFKPRYYILHNGTFTRITSKTGLLKLFADQKSELRSFIKQKGLSFRKDRLLKGLTAVANQYDILNLKPVR
jgi:hypothetical protein